MSHNTPKPPAHKPPPQSQPIDTMLLGSLMLNAERPGRCAQCHAQTTTRRVLRTTYLPPALNRRERDHLTRGDLPEAVVVDGYLQRVARRQLRGDFGDEKRMILCATCATRWLVDCLEHGPGLAPIPEATPSADEATYAARAMVAAGMRQGVPLFAAVVWRIERGPTGRSQASVVMASGGAIAPQLLIRAHADMRRYAREVGRSAF